VIVVWAPETVQLERQMRRDARGRDEALQRIRAQMPLDEKRRLADHVIDNSKTPEETERQVRALYERLVKPSAEGAA
jgi:dephospho-CoA kinase